MPLKLPIYARVGDRPVKAEATAEGGMALRALDWKTGEFVRANQYLTQLTLGGDEVDILDQAQFDALVAEKRAQITRA